MEGRQKPSNRAATTDGQLDPRRLNLEFRATIPSTHEAIGETVERILRLAERHGCAGDDLTDLAIALREALANAIVHGNRNDPQKLVRLHCYCDPEGGMLLIVRDQGRGFDPDGIPDPTQAERIHRKHGRGIFLMRELMDHVEHRKGGREVMLYKRCNSEPPANAAAARRNRKKKR